MEIGPFAIRPTGRTRAATAPATKRGSSFRGARASCWLWRKKNASASEPLRLDIDWAHTPEEKPIDRAAPATWRSRDGFCFPDTRVAYGFAARLKKHHGEAGNLSVRVIGPRIGGWWADLSLAESIRLDGERPEQAIEYLRGLVPEGEVTVEATYVAFPTGQQLLHYVEDIRATLPRDEVKP